MKLTTTGAVRKLTDNGRVNIPKPIREFLLLNKGDSVEYLVDTENNEIYIRKFKAVKL
jgi:AbrB family looped-hinge helix DNA binding protein